MKVTQYVIFELSKAEAKDLRHALGQLPGIGDDEVLDDLYQKIAEALK